MLVGVSHHNTPNVMNTGLLFCFVLFFIPCTAPTAPNCKVCPSIIEASHSTVPLTVKLEPIPAFVQGESSNDLIAVFTASNAGFFSRSNLMACNCINKKLPVYKTVWTHQLENCKSCHKIPTFAAQRISTSAHLKTSLLANLFVQLTVGRSMIPSSWNKER